jgi:transcriptional regulator with XRE-family HTH domain
MVFRPDRLRYEMDRRVLTNAAAAQLIGVTEKTLWRWRSGKSQPQRSHVRRMAAVFEVEPISFYVDTEPNGKAAA